MFGTTWFSTSRCWLMMAAVPLLFARSEARDGILALIILFVVGGYILSKVNVKNGMQAAQDIERKLTAGSSTMQDGDGIDRAK